MTDATPWIEFGNGWAKIHYCRETTEQDRAALTAAFHGVAQASPESLSFVGALSLAERGLEIWKSKEHNAKWWRKIDGTPIPNDLLVNIAEEFSKCGLVYSSSLKQGD